jgi:formamidopyrimidine-DNA glycosylase
LPELPEVETIVRDLSRLVTGVTVKGVTVLKTDLIGNDPADFVARIEGRRLTSFERRAKNIVVRLNGDRLIINLGMTGRVLVVDAKDPEPAHLGVRFELADHRRILYQDVRRFGRLEVISGADWDKRDAELGLEPLSPAFDPAALHKLTRKSRVAMKTWLMDQRRVVGVGNIYASEALFRAKVSPRKAAGRITRQEAGRIHDGVRAVLQEAIDFRGTTLLDYRDAQGETGEFAKRLRVYDRAGEPCVTCGTSIRRIVQGGRSTFFCPTCQK